MKRVKGALLIVLARVPQSLVAIMSISRKISKTAKKKIFKVLESKNLLTITIVHFMTIQKWRCHPSKKLAWKKMKIFNCKNKSLLLTNYEMGYMHKLILILFF